MSGRVEEIRKNGLHTFKNNSRFFGFSVNKPAACNIVIKQLPTSILKDFSGNKHDAYLYGFKGKLNSGVGIYAQDFKNWSYGSTINTDISTKSYNKFHIVKKKADNWFGFTIGIPKNNYYNQSYKLKFNINKKIDDIKFSIVSTDGNLITTAAYSVYINDGNIIDVPIISEEVFKNKEETHIYYDFGTSKDIEIDIELIANYPNQLCYDGKSYAVAYGLPILTDYTVIAKRRWIDKKSENKWFCSLGSGDYTSVSQSLFWFEGGLLNNVFYTYNRGYKNPIVLPELISIQSSDDYNGLHINESNAVQAGNKLFIGSVGENDNTHVTSDFYQLLLFDRVLTDKEREWVKENLIEPNTVSATKACSALFEPENLEIIDEFPNGVIRDSLGGEYYLLPHSSDYTIENGLMKSTDDTFLISIENANENDVKAMIIDMYYDSTVPGSYLNGEYIEGSVKLTNKGKQRPLPLL